MLKKRECIDLTEPAAFKKKIKISSSVTDNCRILIDIGRFRQILLVLLSNAVKYNYEGGSVKIACTPVNSGRVRICVSDTGSEGIGIGLAMCKQLVEEMDGTIGFNSVEKMGNDFWIEIKNNMDMRYVQ